MQAAPLLNNSIYRDSDVVRDSWFLKNRNCTRISLYLCTQDITRLTIENLAGLIESNETNSACFPRLYDR